MNCSIENTSPKLRFSDATIINASVIAGLKTKRKDIAIIVWNEEGFMVYPLIDLDCLSMQRLAMMIERDGKESLKRPTRE